MYIAQCIHVDGTIHSCISHDAFICVVSHIHVHATSTYVTSRIHLYLIKHWYLRHRGGVTNGLLHSYGTHCCIFSKQASESCQIHSMPERIPRRTQAYAITHWLYAKIECEQVGARVVWHAWYAKTQWSISHNTWMQWLTHSWYAKMPRRSHVDDIGYWLCGGMRECVIPQMT